MKLTLVIGGGVKQFKRGEMKEMGKFLILALFVVVLACCSGKPVAVFHRNVQFVFCQMGQNVMSGTILREGVPI